MAPAITSVAVGSTTTAAQQLNNGQRQEHQLEQLEQQLEQQRQQLEQQFQRQSLSTDGTQAAAAAAVPAAVAEVPDFSMQGPYQTLTRLSAGLAVQLDGAPCILKLFVTSPHMGHHLGWGSSQGQGQGQVQAQGQALGQGQGQGQGQGHGQGQNSGQVQLQGQTQGPGQGKGQAEVQGHAPSSQLPFHQSTQAVTADALMASLAGQQHHAPLEAPASGQLPLTGSASGQFPLLLLFSGFQMPAAYYTTYARRLATWGYVVLQYNLPGIMLRKIVRDDTEIAALPQLISWVQDQAQQPGNPLYGAVDVQRLAVMGHSRGAKLAALLLAASASPAAARRTGLRSNLNLNVSTAVLVDPVDMSDQTRKMGYPSAVEALRGLGAKAAVIGAGLTARCNPVAEGYQAFWPQLGQGSWQAVVNKAGHMQFTDASGAAGWALDRLCGAGPCKHEEVMGLSATVSVAWLQNHFRPGAETSAGHDRFLRWAQEQQQRNLLSFETKEAERAKGQPV